MLFFFFNDTATTEIYTLSLHDALPICAGTHNGLRSIVGELGTERFARLRVGIGDPRRRATEHVLSRFAPDERSALEEVRSEEHTSELQSRQYLVCRLLLEKKKTQIQHI